MVRTVERIDRELAELDQAIAHLGDEFYSTYQNYLSVFGQALRQQFIRAAHHICTQVYPQTFLNLSFTQRQNLQQKLVALVQQTQDTLLTSMTHPSQQLDPTEFEVLAELQKLQSDVFGNNPGFSFEPIMNRSSSPRSGLPNLEKGESSSSVKLLSYWLEQQERRLAEHLRQISWEANRLLQQATILPAKLPEPLLEMTLKAELLGGAPTGVPNILDVTLDALKDQLDEPEEEQLDLSHDAKPESSLQPTDQLQGDEEPSRKVPSFEDFLPLLKKFPLRLVAIQMNLTDIEFTAAIAATHRTQIRQLKARFNQIEIAYRKKQQERAVIAAEDAWRASWFES